MPAAITTALQKPLDDMVEGLCVCTRVYRGVRVYLCNKKQKRLEWGKRWVSACVRTCKEV